MPSALELLTKTALVGTARQSGAWTALDGPLAGIWGDLAPMDPEVRLLRAAGILSLATEIGQNAWEVGNPIPVAPPEPELPAISAAAKNVLETILANGPHELFRDVVALLEAKPRALPHELLPSLLSNAASHKTLRRILTNLPGKRAGWLKSLNPAWKKISLSEEPLSEEINDKHWTDGNFAERLAWLEAVRQSDAAKGREALAAVAAQEGAKELQEFVAALQFGLSPDDEPLLVRFLTSKSKIVRQAAAELLEKLPASQRSLNVGLLLRTWVAPGTLELQIPEKFDPAWTREGLEEKPQTGEGNKAFWLRQVISGAPLDTWQALGFATPVDLLQAVIKSDWAEAMLKGVIHAVTQQGHPAWADALLNFPWQSHKKFSRLDVSPLFPVAGPKAIEDWLLSLAASNRLSEAIEYACQQALWSEDFTESLLEHVRNLLPKANDYTLGQTLPRCAFCIPRSKLAAAQAGWGDDAKKYPLHYALHSFLNTLHLRTIIDQELS